MQEVAIDVGGTFTDIVVLHEKQVFSVLKILSTPHDYSEAIGAGLALLAETGEFDPERVSVLIHAFTVATNAVLTGTGAKVGLITTEGFRDVLEIARLRMPRLYDMDWDKPRPIVPRSLRLEVRERVDQRGQVVTPLDVEGARGAIHKLIALGVDSIAVCFLHSYANPAHEERVVQLIREIAPAINVSASHQVLPEIREYERTSTTAINAFIRPVVERYLERLEERLKDLGVSAPLLVTQSAGGAMRAHVAREKPVYCIESGPAAGAVGATAMGKALGERNLIAFDMGGTTAKVCLIEEGEPRLTNEMELGSGINIGQRLLKGAGYLVRVPSIDLAEVGAGGGSIAWIDKGGVLRVGPLSAGANPGPACYGRGGLAPTVTDANVVLGHLSPTYLLGGDMEIDAERARKAVLDGIGKALGLHLDEAAYGIHTVVNSNMVRAIQAVSSEIGRSPIEFTLFAFGGSGPVHACSLAVQAGIRRIIVPHAPGVFSASGLLFTSVEHRFVQTFWRGVESADLEEMNAMMRRMGEEAIGTLAEEGFPSDRAQLRYFFDFRYAGQSSELSIPVESVPITRDSMGSLVEMFHDEHGRTYGYRSPGEPVQLVNLRLQARGISPESASAQDPQRQSMWRERKMMAKSDDRQVYFGPDRGWLTTAVVHRAALGTDPRKGPVVVEEYDTTVVIPPGAEAWLDEAGNIHIDVSPLL